MRESRPLDFIRMPGTNWINVGVVLELETHHFGTFNM